MIKENHHSVIYSNHNDNDDDDDERRERVRVFAQVF